MIIIKRNGKKEEIKFDKILQRVRGLSDDLKVEPVSVAQKVVAGLRDGITSRQVDSLLSETSAVLSSEHPDYSKLAARIAVSALHKETTGFYQTMKQLYKEGYLSDEFISILKEHGNKIEAAIKDERDFNFDYFGYKTLEKSYLLRINKKVVERPQYMYMRAAIGVCGNNIKDVIALYNLMSQGYYTHATPTLFNSGLKKQQLSSCYLVAMEDDSIDGIFNTLKETALISKYAGGIGLHISNVRAKDSLIKGTNGVSNGLVPMLKVFGATASYVDQGGGRRKGSFSIYLEPWHADIEVFLDLKKANGKEEFRARELFLALWIPDLFMQRVEEDGVWSLMCPHECPGLSDVFDDEDDKAFTKLYTKYEKDGKYRKQIKARELMLHILEAQAETGVPYILFKDAANKKSNQKNVGVIKSSNLCTEIIEFSNHEETAVCNLASICLPKFLVYDKKTKTWSYDFDKLAEVARIAAKNLNSVIDRNFYPTEKTKRSNFRHRPVGLGVQGLADVFFQMGYSYDSEEARQLNRDIFETIYFAALTASNEEAIAYGKTLLKEGEELGIQGAYETFKGSPASKGILQFDMWGITPSDRYEWATLKASIIKFGLRNSLLMAPMPTASTSQIHGNTESFEPMTTNIFKRETLAGEFIIVNKYLVKALEEEKLWNHDIRDKIIQGNGSVQNVAEISDRLKNIYRTVWEISQKSIIDMAADRGAFICQSQSMNLHFSKPNFGVMNSALFHAWKRGLKTGAYYTRTRALIDAAKVTTKQEAKPVEQPKENSEVQEKETAEILQNVAEDTATMEAMVCSLDNPEACDSCGS